MKTKIESLDCPNCGALLDVKRGEVFTVCLYCDSSIRLHFDKDESNKTVPQTELSAEVIGKVRQMILDGKKNEAVELYSGEAKISKEDAAKSVEQIYNSITAKIMLERPLSGTGVLLTILIPAIFVVSAYEIFIANYDSPLLKIASWVFLIFTALSLLSISKTIITTFKYLPGKWSDAKILKFGRIGVRKNLTIFRLLLEVTPAGSEVFRVETNLPVRNENVKLIAEGNIIKVKYLQNDKKSVIPSIEELKKNPAGI